MGEGKGSPFYLVQVLVQWYKILGGKAETNGRAGLQKRIERQLIRIPHRTQHFSGDLTIGASQAKEVSTDKQPGSFHSLYAYLQSFALADGKGRKKPGGGGASFQRLAYRT